MSKRFLSGFLVVCLLVVLSALGSLGMAAENKITVIFPRHEMDLKGVWAKQTHEFETTTGIKVELIQMSWDEVADKILTDLAAGGGTYDVIEYDNGWVAKFTAADWVEPLNKYASKEYIPSLLPGLVKTFSKGSDVLGIPWNNDTRFFFYNKDMLQKAGFTQPPKTWDELVTQAKALQDKGICKYPVADYLNAEWGCANAICFYLYSFGGGYFDKNCKITINKGASLEALQFMVDMIRNEKIMDPSSTTLSQEQAGDLLYRGSTAYLFQGPPSLYNYSNDPSKSKVVGQIDVATWLPAKKSSCMTTLTLPEAFSIPKTSRNKKLAWKYISFMISKERDRQRCVEIGSLPLFSSLYNDIELLKAYPYWKQFGVQAQVARPLPQVIWYDELVQTAIVAVQGALLGQKTAKQAADEIAKFLAGKPVGTKKLTM